MPTSFDPRAFPVNPRVEEGDGKRFVVIDAGY